MSDDFTLEPFDYIDWDEGRDFPAPVQAEDENQETAYQEEPALAAAERDPEAGDRIEVTGGTRAFTGIVVGTDEMLLIVAEVPGRLTYIRRNAGSMDPHTWRCAGRPVRVTIVTRAITRASHESFSRRLEDLKRKTPR